MTHYIVIERQYREDIAIAYRTERDADFALMHDPIVDDLCNEDCTDAYVTDNRMPHDDDEMQPALAHIEDRVLTTERLVCGTCWTEVMNGDSTSLPEHYYWDTEYGGEEGYTEARMGWRCEACTNPQPMFEEVRKVKTYVQYER